MNFENDLHEDEAQEREISLGTSTIVGIFLVLALVCAAFFGFGYSLGRHSAQTVAATAAPEKSDLKPDNTFSNFKTAPDPPTSDSDAPEPAPTKAAKAAPVALTQPTEDAPADKPATHVPAAALPTTSSAGQFVVQVSATTRQSDAEALLAVLKRKGYTAAIKQGADSRFHVQVGPFASKADAETTRKQLDADGYKGPFIK